MHHVNTQDAIEKIQSHNKVVLWGASSSGLRALSNLSYCQKIGSNKFVFYDSDPNKIGKYIGGLRIISKNEFQKIMNESGSLCVVTSSVLNQIEKELSELRISNWIYSHGLVYTDKIFDKFEEKFLQIYNDIKFSTNLDADELYTIYNSANTVSNLDGDYAEVGVYRGGSACLVSHQLKNKKLFLFDTFEGLPDDKTKQIENEPLAGWLDDTKVENVINLVKTSGIDEENIIVCKGYFPDETSHFVSESDKFCLIHLDTDRYDSTLEGLRFFYPKLNRGGRVIIHDYNCIGTPGVKKAVDQFVEENLLQLNFFSVCESQALLFKL